MKKKYHLFSKQWWKEFNRQSKEDKQKILQVIIEETVNKALTTAYTDSMITGIYFKSEALYEKYVQPLDKLDSHSEEWSTLVTKLLSEIRVNHLDYMGLKAGKDKAFGKSAEGNNEG